MSTLDFSKYSDAEKIVLAEELWDSVVKDEIQINEKTKSVMLNRLKRIEDGEAIFFLERKFRKKSDSSEIKLIHEY